MIIHSIARYFYSLVLLANIFSNIKHLFPERSKIVCKIEK